MRDKPELRRELLEAVERVEQRKQKEAAKEARRRRRVLAKIGLTPEEFEEGVRQFARKFYGA
jgi:ribosomal protein L44E